MDKDKMQTILEGSLDIISKFLDPKPLLTTMVADGALTNEESQLIKSKVLKSEQCGELINILMRKPVTSYDVFMKVLHKNRPDLHEDIKKIERRVVGGEDDPDVGKPVNPQSSVRPKEDDRKPSSYSGQPSDDDLDEYMGVAPDSDGDYKKRHIQPARPTKEQLIPKNNYDMKSEVKGLAYILNIKCFKKKSKDRLGSDVDFRNMKHLFTELGYEIIHHENLTAEEIRQTIKTFVSKFDDPDSYLSSVVVLMSHGGRGFIVGNDHKRVKLADILADFEGCQNLKGKPKLFFVQACRGKSITLADNLQYDEDMEVDEPIDTDIPNNADIHIAHSTTEGYLSLRSKIKGSWFVQAISEEFLSHAHKDNLDTLMNRVTYRVTEKKGNNWYDYENDMEVTARQTPEVLKRMRKALYFLPKYPPTY